ncbi:MAG: hypothetical protein V4712_17725 [Pseudomonadota bacterium]
MCDIGLALLGLSVGGGVYSAYSQNQMAKQNAAFARYEAEQTREIGKANEARSRDRMGRLIARQRGQLAARGVRLDSASALDLGEEGAKENFMEAQASRFNTDVRVKSKLNEAAISDYTARTALVNGVFGTGAKALGQSLDLWPELQGA